MRMRVSDISPVHRRYTQYAIYGLLVFSSRQPLLFFVSSIPTKRTVSTEALCYISSDGAVANTCSVGSKRRMVNDNLEATDGIKATAVAESPEDGVIR